MPATLPQHIAKPSRRLALVGFIAGLLLACGSFFPNGKSVQKSWRLTRKSIRARWRKFAVCYRCYFTTGRRGERIAARYLRRNGYTIRHQNWRCKFGELDLVVQKDRTLVFVEVKTRANEKFPAIEALDQKKHEQLKKLAIWYYRDFESEIRYKRLQRTRFDAIAVMLDKGLRPVIRHYRNI